MSPVILLRWVTNFTIQGDETALANVRRVTGDNNYVPSDPTEMCNRVLVTCYMGSENSSEETKARAKVHRSHFVY